MRTRRRIHEERVAANLRRLRMLLPIMVVVHVSWILMYSSRSPIDAGEAAWASGVVRIHICAACASGVMLLIARRDAPGLRRLRLVLGELWFSYSVAIGVAICFNTLHFRFSTTAWMICVILAAVCVYPRALIAGPVLLLGAAGAMIASFSADAGGVGFGQATNALALGLLAFLSQRVLYGSFVREVTARLEVESMNAQLAERVAAQVGEIVKHAEHIEGLNRQLADQVQSRSRELASALERLAEVEHGEELLRAGTLIGGRFEIAHTLGVGGMGVVYAAYDKVGRQQVALKLVHGNVGGVGGAYRFLQEANATASLSHAAIVRVLHVDVTDDGRLYQVQELVEGHTLDRLVEDGRALPAPMVARLGAVLADALATAHAHGVVHRDVKPQNIMMTRVRPGCRLLDFGLAKLRRSMVSSNLTEHGTVIGTPQFLAPEQIATPDSVGGAADVYAFGIVLYLCATGRLPYDASTSIEWLHAHTAVAPNAITLDAVPELGALIMRCLSKDPAARPSASALATALGEIADRLGAETLEQWSASEDRTQTRPLMAPRATA